jgi:hypothetical protein
MINAGNGPRIRDGVDQPTKLAGDAFPYLAAPNPVSPKLLAGVSALIAGAGG